MADIRRLTEVNGVRGWSFRSSSGSTPTVAQRQYPF